MTMAAVTEAQNPAQLGDAIVSFALDGHFPDEEVSSLSLANTDLSPALAALSSAKSRLESEVHTINAETKEEVSSWVANAKSLQEDILRSKRMADDIIRQSEAPVVSGRAIAAAQDHVDLLEKEAAYTLQLHEALRGIRHVNELLSEAEQARNDRRLLDALRWLEKSWTELDAIPVNNKSCRIMRLLDVRAFELKSSVHDVFDHVWNALVHVDQDAGRVAIYDRRDDEPMTLSEAVLGLEAYKEVDDRMARLWQDIDQAIVAPRMEFGSSNLSSVEISENTLQTSGQAGETIDDLFQDLKTVVEYLTKRLPPELLIYLGPIMMSDVIPRLINVWLASAVPSSLQEIDKFQAVIKSAETFCAALEASGLSGFTELKEWVGSAPSIWFGKRRETALDTVRTRLAQGLGEPKEVERVEKQMVSRSEGKELTAQGVAAHADDDDWGTAWGADDDDDQPPESEEPKVSAPSKTPAPAAKVDEPGEEDDGADAWGWDDEGEGEGDDGQGQESNKQPTKKENNATLDDDDDDAAAAWGWGDEDQDQDVGVESPKTNKKTVTKSTTNPPETSAPEESREMVLKELYHISSMPDPVLELILAILEDGAALLQPANEGSPVAAAAAGLFSLPTFALAMFRAVSPHYYALEAGGNMFLYNDAMYLAEKLTDLETAWKSREDVPLRARTMLRMENDIKGLQSFANRAYSGELGVQKTVIRDLLGGEQHLLQQDDVENSVDMAMAHIRTMASTWETILARSVWNQALGSLADALSAQIITNVMEMPSIGQEEAYKIAKLIATVTELDDLFLPSRATGQPRDAEEIPATAQYASTWLRLKYLSEVLQSNLNEVRYLWCDSELSLYFTAEEVIDLIEASFEANARTKDTIRQIRDRPPHPIEA